MNVAVHRPLFRHQYYLIGLGHYKVQNIQALFGRQWTPLDIVVLLEFHKNINVRRLQNGFGSIFTPCVNKNLFCRINP